MTSAAQVLAFGGIVLVAAASPGPDFVVVMRNALTGRRAGMACAVGIGAGVFVWSAVTALGIAGLLAASAVAFTAVKLVGAAYLVFLGLRALLAARRGGYSEHGAPTAVRGSAAALRQGLLTNLLNPKVAVFFLALVPQFLPAGATVGHMMLLGAVAATVSVLWYFLLTNVVGAMRRLFTRARVRRAIDAVMGTLLVGLGIRIAVQSN